MNTKDKNWTFRKTQLTFQKRTRCSKLKTVAVFLHKVLYLQRLIMIHSPILIIGCPRSGTTLLFNILSELPDLWSIGYESKAIIEHHHHPRTKNWESGVLNEADLTAESRTYMLAEFQRQAASGTFWHRANRFRATLRSNRIYQAIKSHGETQSRSSVVSSALPQQGLNTIRQFVRLRNTVLPARGSIRLLEKTPENCLRLPFLEALFPNLKVIYLVRDGRANVNSLMEGWRQAHAFPGYQVPGGVRIPGDQRGRWAFSLISGWQGLADRPLEEVCAWQWIRCNEAVLAHQKQTHGRVPYLTIHYENLVAAPEANLQKIADFIVVDDAEPILRYAEDLPQINTVSSPHLEKWRKQNGASIERIVPIIEPMMQRLEYVISDR